jgi:hypothetical protein
MLAEEGEWSFDAALDLVSIICNDSLYQDDLIAVNRGVLRLRLWLSALFRLDAYRTKLV